MDQFGIPLTIRDSHSQTEPKCLDHGSKLLYQPISVLDGPLRVALVHSCSRALGPGLRAVIWFQGCSLNCAGCIAAEMNNSPPLFKTTPEKLADWCGSIKGIQGVTLSGGDPFDQPLDALADFVKRLHELTTLDILIYTGRTLALLRASSCSEIASILNFVDILIDGPYVEALNDGIGWRGSNNQRIHKLSNRHVSRSDIQEVKRHLEVVVDANGVLSMVGLPTRGRAGRLASQLLAGLDEKSKSGACK